MSKSHVVQKKLGEHLRIGAEGLKCEDFLFGGGVGGFEDAEEDFRDEDFYLGFEMGLEFPKLRCDKWEKIG